MRFRASPIPPFDQLSKIGSVMIQQILSTNGIGSGFRAHAIGEYHRAGEIHVSNLKPGQVYDEVGD
jgi:hypothetical protein